MNMSLEQYFRTVVRLYTYLNPFGYVYNPANGLNLAGFAKRILVVTAAERPS